MTSQATPPEGRRRITSVSTSCPFCSGGKMLSVGDEIRTKADVIRLLTGKRVQCEHPQCGRSFELRRDDIEVRLTRSTGTLERAREDERR